MKQKKALLLAIIAMGFAGCNNSVQEQPGADLKYFTEGHPVTIKWDGGKKDGIQSFQASVEVYSMNSRHDSSVSLSQTYRMAVKIADEKTVSRMDFDFDESVPFRSAITDGEETLIFNPSTEEVGYRIPAEKSENPLYNIMGTQNSLSRMNLSLIRDAARRLSLDMREENDDTGTKLLLELPPEMIPPSGTDKIISSRVAFNLNNETLSKNEIVMMREDGTVVTTTVIPVYEDKEGTPIKIGAITVIDSKAPGLIEGIDPDIPIYNSPDDIRTITESEFAEKQADGAMHEIPEITFGNPGDLSYTETIYEVYRDVIINDAPESLFRLIQE